MTKTYAPFDNQATYEDTWRKFMSLMLASGVVAGALNEHRAFADATGMQVKVMSGRSWIQGHFFEDDAQETIAIAAADATNPRIDRLVIRADFSANTVDYAILQGTPAASPTAVALTTSTTRWEIPIAQIRVDAAVATIAATKVTDERVFSRNANLPTDPIAPNQLVNPEFDIWSRGAGPFTATSAFTADYWAITLAGTDTLSVARVTAAANKKPNSKASAGLTFVLGTGAGATKLRQTLTISDGYEHLLGQAISMRMAVKGSVANGIRLFITTDGTGGTTTYSSYHAGDAAFNDLIIQGVTVPTDATYVQIGVALSASGTYYVDNAGLNLGSVAAAFMPLQAADDLARCQRYYEYLGGDNVNDYLLTLQGWSGTQAAGPWLFRVQKAIVPTITFSAAADFLAATAAANNVGTAIAAASPGTRGCRVLVTVAAGLAANNAVLLVSNNANARMIAEANP